MNWPLPPTPSFDPALLRAVADRIVPPDDKTPGAAESGAFDYLWAQLSQGDLTGQQENYHAALQSIAALSEGSGGSSGAPFTDLTGDAQDEILRAFGKQNPRFFARMVEHVQEGFYITQAAWDMIGWKVTV